MELRPSFGYVRRMLTRIVAASVLWASVSSAQPVQKLPGGAVMKPGHPPPIVPLAAPSEMKALEPLVGSFTATSPDGAQANVTCAPTADAAWLRCDLQLPAGSAAVVIGWVRSARGYRAFVADSRSAAHVFKGTIKNGTLGLRGDDGRKVAIAVAKTPVVVIVGSQPWTLAPASAR